MRVELRLPRPGTVAHDVLLAHPVAEVETALDHLLALENEPDCAPDAYREAEAAFDNAYQRAAERASMALRRERAQARAAQGDGGQSGHGRQVRARAREAHRQHGGSAAGGDADGDGGDPDPDPDATPDALPVASSTDSAGANPAAVQIVEGDAIQVLATFPPEIFDGVVTDPPHDVLRQQSWDELPTVELWRAVFRVLKPGAPLVAIGAPQTYDLMVGPIRAAGFAVEDMAIWAFATGRPASERRLKRAHAPILIARKPGPKLSLNIEEGRLPFLDDHDRDQTKRANDLRFHAKRRSGVYDGSLDTSPPELEPFVPKSGRWPATVMLTEPALGEHDRFFLVPVVRDRHGHPAAKPVRLLAQLVRLFIPTGGLLLDPFAGGGSTGTAAASTGRRAILIERDPSYVSMARHAIETDTGVVPAFAHHGNEISVNSATSHVVQDTSDHEELRHIELSSQCGTNCPATAAAQQPNVSAAPVDAASMAGHLGGHVAACTLIRWARSGRIPAAKVGRTWLFDPAEVVAVLSEVHRGKEVMHVDPRNSTTKIRRPDLPFGPARRTSSSSLQTSRGTRGGREAGETVRVRGDRVGRPAQPHQGGEGARDSACRAADSAQLERIRNLLGGDLPAVGSCEPRPEHDASPRPVDLDPGAGPGQHPAAPDRKRNR